MLDTLFFGHLEIVLAFIFRTGALTMAILLARYFARSTGPIVFRLAVVFWSFAALFAWVTVASIGELSGLMIGWSTFVEYGAGFIFVPNLIVFAPMFWLWLGLPRGRPPEV